LKSGNCLTTNGNEMLFDIDGRVPSFENRELPKYSKYNDLSQASKKLLDSECIIRSYESKRCARGNEKVLECAVRLA